MNPCERGESLVVLADKFANTITDLVNEIKSLNARVEKLEAPTAHVVSDIAGTTKKLKIVADELESATHK